MSTNNTFKSIPLFLALSLCAATTAHAVNEKPEDSASKEASPRVSIEWVEPKTYTDTRSNSMSASKHRKYIFKELDEHLQKLATNLPDGQSLKVTVTDLDLAGRVEPGRFSGLTSSMQDIRVIRHIDIPRMQFSFELIDQSGEVLRAQEVKLKDMNFLNGIKARFNERPYEYEKRMITKWFEKNLLDKNV